MTWDAIQGLKALPAVGFIFVVIVGLLLVDWPARSKIAWLSLVAIFILSLLGEFIWASLVDPGSSVGVMGFLLIVVASHELAKRVFGPVDKGI